MEALARIDSELIERDLDSRTLVSRFLASQDIREISKNAYRNGLDRFLSWAEENSIQQPDRNTILSFKSYLSNQLLAANTINSYLAAVKSFFSWLEGMKLYPDIAKDIKGLPQPKGHLRESLTTTQIQDLLSRMDQSTEIGCRDFALINLMVRTGLRTIEIIRADVADMRQEAGEALLYVHGKGRDSKDAFVLLTDKTLKPLLAYLKRRDSADPSAPLFSSLSDRNRKGRLTTRTVRMIVKRHLREMDLDNRRLSAHSLRHSFATIALRGGAPLLQVKEALRHSSIETTEKYLHNLDRIDKGAERYINF